MANRLSDRVVMMLHWEVVTTFQRQAIRSSL